MIPSDPNFGKSFNSQEFTSAILSVMEMGTPNKVEERATFIWRDEVRYGETDEFNLPYDVLDQENRVKEGKRVQALCTYRFVDRAGNDTPVGQFNNDRLVATMLGVEYEKVKGHYKALFGGNKYTLIKVEPPIALFDVDVYELHYQADDEA